MKPNVKTLMTASLLVFAVVTVGVAVRDEVRRQEGEARSVSNSPRVVPVAASPTVGAIEVSPRPTAPSAGPALSATTGGGSPSAAAEARAPSRVASLTASVPAAKTTKLIVYYFHTTTRCVSCFKIENLTQFSLDSDFGVELADGDIEWRPVNIDTPGNGHYAKDYGLFTKSVVLSAVREGREQKWRNLDRVWHLLDDPKGFREYIGEEVRTFRTAS